MRPAVRKSLALAPLGVFMGLAILLFVGLRGDPHKIPSVLVGKPAPDFVLAAPGAAVGDPQEASRGGLSKADLMSGEPVVINVWASWCGPCRIEHPVLMQAARRGDVAIYGLNYKDKPADALRFLGELGNPYTKSGADISGRVGIDFGVYGVPETFVINGRGEIVLKHVGPLDARSWMDTILPAVKAARTG